MKIIQRRQAHVWTLSVGPADGPAIERLRSRSLLSDDEKSRSERISDARNHRQYLAAHILLHLMLSHFSNVKAADWHFVDGPHGRPEPGPGIESQGLRFNLSHARGMVACAVTLQDDIGIDVEWMERCNDLAGIAEKKFAAQEAAYFSAASEEDRARIFFSFWTLKEAYIKAIGRGLLEPLNGFAFALEDLKISFLSGQDKGDCWSFDLFQPSPVHLAALALARPPGAVVEITRRHLDWDQVAAL